MFDIIYTFLGFSTRSSDSDDQNYFRQPSDSHLLGLLDSDLLVQHDKSVFQNFLGSLKRVKRQDDGDKRGSKISIINRTRIVSKATPNFKVKLHRFQYTDGKWLNEETGKEAAYEYACYLKSKSHTPSEGDKAIIREDETVVDKDTQATKLPGLSCACTGSKFFNAISPII